MFLLHFDWFDFHVIHEFLISQLVWCHPCPQQSCISDPQTPSMMNHEDDDDDQHLIEDDEVKGIALRSVHATDWHEVRTVEI